MDFLKLFAYALAIIAVFVLTWFATRLVARNGSFNGKGKYVTILEKFPVTKDSYLMIVKSFDRLLLVGVTAGGMTLLKEFEDDEINLDDYHIEKQSFSSVFMSTLESTLPDGKFKKAIDKVINKGKGGDDDVNSGDKNI